MISNSIKSEREGIFQEILAQWGVPSSCLYFAIYYLSIRIASVFNIAGLTWSIQDCVAILQVYGTTSHAVAFAGLILISVCERVVNDVFLFDDRKRQRMKEKHAAELQDRDNVIKQLKAENERLRNANRTTDDKLHILCESIRSNKP